MNTLISLGARIDATRIPLETLELILLLLLLILRFGQDLVFGAMRQRVVWFGRATRMISTPLLIIVLAIVVARLLS